MSGSGKILIAVGIALVIGVLVFLFVVKKKKPAPVAMSVLDQARAIGPGPAQDEFIRQNVPGSNRYFNYVASKQYEIAQLVWDELEKNSQSILRELYPEHMPDTFEASRQAAHQAANEDKIKKLYGEK